LTLFNDKTDEVFVIGAYSRFIFDVPLSVYDKLGFGSVGDETFRQMVCARVIEPTGKLDASVRNRILRWLDQNVEGTANPRLFGQPLSGDLAGFWRYKIGRYRVVARICDEIVTVVIVRVAQRRNVYQAKQ
jgi:mRNA interferase RelE/StbE